MTTKSKIEEIKEGFGNLSNSLSQKDKFDNDAKVLMFRFLEIIDEARNNRNWSRGELAKSIGVSASFMSQLYNGDKLINFTQLAKLQDALGLSFKVERAMNEVQSIVDLLPKGDGKGVWVYKPFEAPDYNKVENYPLTDACMQIVA